MIAKLTSGLGAARGAALRVWREPRLRGEITWTILTRLIDIAFPFIQVKLLTNLLHESKYGEYMLALTAVALGNSTLILPVTAAYQRYFHAAPGENAARRAGLYTLRWMAYVTTAVMLLAALFSSPAGRLLGWETWTILAAGVVFAADRWRMFVLEIFEFERLRSSTAMFALGFQLALVAGLVLIFAPLSRTATAALLCYALCGLPFTVLGLRRLWPVLAPRTGDEPGRMSSLVRTFGIPSAILATFQWVQTNADRYILSYFLPEQEVGRYVAVFQICGVPYLIMLQTLVWLLTPIVYNRARNSSDASRLWSADRIMIGAIAFFTVGGTLLLGVYWMWSEELTTLLTRKSYVLPAGTVLLIAVGRFLQCFAMLLQVVFAVHEKMSVSLFFRVIGALLTVPLCWILVGRSGIDGAALGTALAGGVYLLILGFGPGGLVWLMRETRRQAVVMARSAASAEVSERG